MRSMLSGLTIAMIITGMGYIFLGSENTYGLEVGGSECAELRTVEQKLLEDPLVQSFVGLNCSAVELLVKRDFVGSTQYDCVKGYVDGTCPKSVEDIEILFELTNSILIGLISEENPDVSEEEIIDELIIPDFSAAPVAVAPPTPAPTVSETIAEVAPTVTSVSVADEEIKTISLDQFGVFMIDGVPTYNPNPDDAVLNAAPVKEISEADKARLERLFGDKKESAPIGQEDEIQNGEETAVVVEENENSLEEKDAPLVGIPSDSSEDDVDGATKPYLIETNANPDGLELGSYGRIKDSVVVPVPAGFQDKLVKGEFYVFTDEAVLSDEVLETVMNDLIEKFGKHVESVHKIFPMTNLTNDFIVRYNADAVAFGEIVEYLNKNNLYISDKGVSVQENFFFPVATSSPIGVSFIQVKNEVVSLFNRLTGGGEPESVSFTTQSADTLEQRHLEYIGYNEIQECLPEGRSVKVAIVDNGFDITHPDLDDKIVAMYDEADKDSDIQVPNFKKEWNHGTKEAGLVGAESDDKGVTGIFPNSELILVKATKDAASGKDITNGIEAIAKAYELGADVINLSRGAFGNVPILEKVTKAVASKDVYIVAAAGNYNKEEPFYPAAYDWVVSVAAIDDAGSKASFSNYGDWIDIAAPGVDMLTTDLNNSYEEYNGTSEASPVVAGALGLALSYGFDREDLKDNVFPVDAEGIGAGIIDLRFMCDLLPDDFDIEEEEHNSGGTLKDSISSGTLFIVFGGLLLLLGLIGGLISYLSHKKNKVH